MSFGYDIGPLRASQVDRAYAVMQAVMPGLAIERWRGAVGTIFERNRFTVATDRQGYVRGMLLARLCDHPFAGRLFDVPIFIVVSPLHEDGIARELFGLVKQRALDARCVYMRFWTLGTDDWDKIADEAFRDRWDHGLVYRL
ncbi:hypothetical protein EV286_108253 [Rhizobium sp. BK251]|nr:hypothetical protein EV286_108253 [Rhizobium sp. BK251]